MGYIFNSSSGAGGRIPNFAGAPVNFLVADQPKVNIPQIQMPDMATDYVNMIQLKDNMEQAKIRNRLNTMSLEAADRENRIQKAIVGSYGGEEQYAGAQALRQKEKEEEERQKAHREARKGEVAAKIKRYETLVDKAIEVGDSELLNKINENAMKDPDLAPIAGIGNGITVTGKSEFTTVVPLTPNVRMGLLERAKTVEGDDSALVQSILWATGTHAKIKSKNGKIIEFEVVKDPNAPTKEPASTEANYRIGLENQMKKDHPDWSPERIQFEAAKKVREENAEAMKGKMVFNANLKDDMAQKAEERKKQAGWAGWDQAEKVTAIWDNIISGKDPKFAWGDRHSYTQFLHDKTKYMNDNGITPGMAKAAQADMGSKTGSLKNQQKIIDMMSSFVSNINKQVDKVSTLINEANRYNLKLANIPQVEWRTKIQGSGLEANIKSYLLEISNEIGKLSTGSAASIRELGENAQVKWEKIHDTTLPAGELLKVLQTTKDQANMRITASQEILRYTKQAIEGVGKEMGAPQQSGNKPSAPASNKPVEKRKPGETPQEYLKRVGPRSSLGNDTILAHISPAEAEVLESLGGSGHRNPKTGIRQFSNPELDEMFEKVKAVQNFREDVPTYLSSLRSGLDAGTYRAEDVKGALNTLLEQSKGYNPNTVSGDMGSAFNEVIPNKYFRDDIPAYVEELQSGYTSGKYSEGDVRNALNIIKEQSRGWDPFQQKFVSPDEVAKSYQTAIDRNIGAGGVASPPSTPSNFINPSDLHTADSAPVDTAGAAMTSAYNYLRNNNQNNPNYIAREPSPSGNQGTGQGQAAQMANLLYQLNAGQQGAQQGVGQGQVDYGAQAAVMSATAWLQANGFTPTGNPQYDEQMRQYYEHLMAQNQQAYGYPMGGSVGSGLTYASGADAYNRLSSQYNTGYTDTYSGYY